MRRCWLCFNQQVASSKKPVESRHRRQAGELRATLIMQGLAEHNQGQTRPHGCVRMGACAVLDWVPKCRSLDTADWRLWTVYCWLWTVHGLCMCGVQRTF